MDQSIRIESTALAIKGACANRTRFGQIWFKKFPRLGEMAPVYDTQGCCCREFGPVDGFAEPVQIIAEEFVVGGSLVHKRVAEGNSCVENRVSSLEAVSNPV